MILHVIKPDKFIPPFIEFVDEYFGRDNHKFVFISKESYEYGLRPESNVEFLHTTDDIFITLKGYMRKARKIMLHGLWREEINVLLYFNQELLRKCYWLMWGGDFYFPEKHSQIKKEIIKNMGYLVTYIKGDVELARKWYGAQGKHIECLMYTSNLYQDYELKPKRSATTTILLGNSADPTNNHSEILQQLAQFKDKNIKVITPLSYGNQKYAQQVITEGKQLLGNKFQALTEFMPFADYLIVLSEVDVAIFNHKRQQAMGNTIALLGLGKKVYMRSDVAQWGFFKKLGVEVNDGADLINTLFNKTTLLDNKKLIKDYFSEKNLKKQLRLLYE